MPTYHITGNATVQFDVNQLITAASPDEARDIALKKLSTDSYATHSLIRCETKCKVWGPPE